MKKLYDRFWRMQEDGKIGERTMNVRLALAATVIVACMFCMGITAYAYFSCTVTSKISIIQSAKFYLNEKITEVLPEDAPDNAVAVGIVKNAEGYYVLEHKLPVVEEPEQMEVAETAEYPAPVEDRVFEIKLTKPADVTASVGFARIEVLTDTEEKQLFYTEPIRRSETADEYVFYVHVPAGKSVKIRIVDNWGTCARGPVLKNGAVFTPDFVDAAYMHISFDEVEYSLMNLATSEYDSIYEEPFFAWMRELHETYGAKFSLYTYTSVLTEHGSTLEKYQKEFADAKDWLKFGLHAEEKNMDFSAYTAEQGAAAWDRFVKEVVQITGTQDSVDRMPRLYTFAGSAEALTGMKDATNGALGFLSADDDRSSYYLDAATNQYLYTNDYYIDQTNDLVFVATDLRLDWFESDFTSQNAYRKPTKESAYEELKLRYQDEAYEDSRYSYIVFGHEWQFYNEDGFIEEKDAGEIWKSWIEEVCCFANDNSVYFHYPQEKEFALPEVTKPAEDTQEQSEESMDEQNEELTDGVVSDETSQEDMKTEDENTEEPSMEITNPEETDPEETILDDTTKEDTAPTEIGADHDADATEISEN